MTQQNKAPTHCENCTMDLSVCDCVEQKPVRYNVAPSASPASLTVAAQGLLSAWDSANTNEKYDECKFEAFSGSGAIQRLRESLAASPADQVEDARDAARYRWLRENGVWLDPNKYAKAKRVLDDAIDAAMSASKEGA